MSNSNVLSTQWMNRPDDQRFLSMEALHAFNVSKKARSIQKGVALDHMRVAASDGNGLTLRDPEKLGSDGQPVLGAGLTHWAFGQLCQRAKAPAAYLRSLPAELAQIPLQWSLEQAREDGQLLMRRAVDSQAWTIDAITSDTYGRIWDAEMTGAILENVDLGRWKVPSASYASSNPKKATTLYASDRDCFVCLVDEEHVVEVPGVGGGEPERLFRGFIARQSEVGSAAFELTLFLYRHICDNRIIWGMGNVQNLRIRHTSGGPMRFMREARPSLTAYAQSATAETVEVVKRAREKEVGKSEKDVGEWLKARGFTQTQSKRAVELASGETGLNPRSLWGVVQGLTAQAHEMSFGDERLELEKKAGQLIQLAA